MKKLLPLMVLATLVSCNDTMRSRSTITSNDSTIEKYSSGLSTQRGTVAFIMKQGTQMAIDYTKTSGLLSSSPVNTRTTSVIINIDGNKTYKHLTIENMITKETTQQIVLEEENIKQELKEILDSGKGKVIGDNLQMKYSEELPASSHAESEYFEKLSYNSNVNLWKPHCDSRSQINSVGTILINGEVDSTQKTQIIHTSTCGKNYTVQQLKAIDLSSIEFCSYPDGSRKECESDRDMSFLTSDLQ